MLCYAAIFFIIAIIAVVLGFTGIAVSATGISKAMFVLFLIVAVVSLVLGRRAHDALT
jgi:uncharacterized membrane protein YtjA (UPF0391 family)